jgi:hypothetical protein
VKKNTGFSGLVTANSMNVAFADLFQSFCEYGATRIQAHSQQETAIDNARFIKMMRDTGLLDQKFSKTKADLIFSQVKIRGKRRIPYQRFCKIALPLIATAKYPGLSAVEGVKRLVETLLTSSGPAINSNVVHRPVQAASLLSAAQASPARDTSIKQAGHLLASQASQEKSSGGDTTGESALNFIDSEQQNEQDTAQLAVDQEEISELKNIFNSFCKFGLDRLKSGNEQLMMDSAHFAKLTRDAHLLHSDGLTPAQVDLVFAKSKLKGRRTLSFDDFLRKAIPGLAVVHSPELDPLQATETLVHYLLENGAEGPTNVASVQHKANSRQIVRSMEKLSARQEQQNQERFQQQQDWLDAGEDLLDALHPNHKPSQPAQPPAPPGSTPEASASSMSLEQAGFSAQSLFLTFCNYGKSKRQCHRTGGASGVGDEAPFALDEAWETGMSSKAFAKLVKDAGLVDSKLSRTDVDLIFTKAASLQQQFEQYVHKSIISPRSPAYERELQTLGYSHANNAPLARPRAARAWIQRHTEQHPEQQFLSAECGIIKDLGKGALLGTSPDKKARAAKSGGGGAWSARTLSYATWISVAVPLIAKRRLGQSSEPMRSSMMLLNEMLQSKGPSTNSNVVHLKQKSQAILQFHHARQQQEQVEQQESQGRAQSLRQAARELLVDGQGESIAGSDPTGVLSGFGAPLRTIFEKFAVHGRSAALKKGEVTLDSVDLDTARFAKMMRDCSLLDKRRLNRAASDLVFTKCKTRASASSGVKRRTIDYKTFVLEAIPCIADLKYKETPAAAAVEALVSLIVQSDGPINNAVQHRQIDVKELVKLGRRTGREGRSSAVGSGGAPPAQEAEAGMDELMAALGV